MLRTTPGGSKSCHLRYPMRVWIDVSLLITFVDGRANDDGDSSFSCIGITLIFADFNSPRQHDGQATQLFPCIRTQWNEME